MTQFPSNSILRPLLSNESWLIGPTPKLPEQITPNSITKQECVDHHLFQDKKGTWHLWGCIRGTITGRILYHWEGEHLNLAPWQQTGEYIRPDNVAGESVDDWEDQEWIQSPYIVRSSDLFYFFYGGHSTGLDRNGNKVPSGDANVECQICLMTSENGRQWVRYLNEQGQSRLFTGPGEARDPCVIRIGDSWFMYYAGHESGNPLIPGIYLRTSLDLIHWSDPILVHRNQQTGFGRWTHECPHVVQRDGSFYLFYTEDYFRARTHVFRSKDLLNFGVDNFAPEKYVGLLPLAAPEVIVDENGSEYITSCHDLLNGIRIFRLFWTRD